MDMDRYLKKMILCTKFTFINFKIGIVLTYTVPWFHDQQQWLDFFSFKILLRLFDFQSRHMHPEQYAVQRVSNQLVCLPSLYCDRHQWSP